ncbi:MAG: hypothetical protein J6577_10810 [Gilliamella sp.]|nr:hypothetical protein [Gilliamella sp.]MCO6557703.1 hypothetical protein [Gilliamella sp.]
MEKDNADKFAVELTKALLASDHVAVITNKVKVEAAKDIAVFVKTLSVVLQSGPEEN